MATSRNPGPAGGASNPNVDPMDVGRIEKEALAWNNILKLKGQINKANKEQADIQKELNKLQGQEAANALNMKRNATALAALEKNLATARANGNRNLIKSTERLIAMRKANEANLANTIGGSMRMQEMAAAKQKASLTAERNLIKDINKERGVGARIADLFRSKEQKQKSIDMARLKSGGGANTGASAAGGAAAGALAAAGPAGAMAAAALAAVEKMKAPFKALAGVIKDSLTAPLGEAAAILGSGKVGIGGGKVSGAGATSMLDGLGKIASSIPFIGGLLGGLVGAFKTVLDAVLGIDQANVNVARSLGISKKEAQGFRDQMQAASLATNNIAVNQTRLVEQQLALSKELGVSNQLSTDTLENNVKLVDILGVQVSETRQIAESSLITGKSSSQITKNVFGQIGYLKQTTGLAFKYQDILSETSKLSGVLGLTFAKYPEKLTKSLLTVKALGLSLKQVEDLAGGFLDFESSISKEFEAQVLTGKEINLTKAREAALNNDLVTVAKEVTKYTGNSANFLKMNRIEADALAGAMNMTREQMADMLKQQEILNALGAKDMQQAIKKFEAVKNNGTERDKLVKQIGAENYAELEKVSIAEKLAAVMEKIKQTFIAFVEKSKIFDFLTDEKKVNGFIKSMLDNLAGAINMVGEIAAGIMDAISHLPFTDKDKYQGLAEQIRGGAGSFAGSVRSVGGGIGLAEGGVVTQTGMAKVDKGEVYLGANSISVLKDMLDAQREQNKHLMALLAKDTRLSIDGQAIAVANAKNATTIYQGQTS
jgi:hypothetical protein